MLYNSFLASLKVSRARKAGLDRCPQVTPLSTEALAVPMRETAAPLVLAGLSLNGLFLARWLRKTPTAPHLFLDSPKMPTLKELRYCLASLAQHTPYWVWWGWLWCGLGCGEESKRMHCGTNTKNLREQIGWGENGRFYWLVLRTKKDIKKYSVQRMFIEGCLY